MAKAIFFTLPHHGHVNPNIGLLKELVKRGDMIVCYSSISYKGIIEETGARWREYKVNLEAFFFKKGNQSDDITETNEDIRLNIEKAFDDIEALFSIAREIYLKHYKEIADEGVEYFIYDSFAIWGKIFANKLGIPSVCCESLFVMTDKVFNANIECFIAYLTKTKNIDLITSIDKKQVIDCMNYNSKRIQRKLAIKDFNFSGYFYSDYLNIVYLIKEMQPCIDSIVDKYVFVGLSDDNYSTGTERIKCKKDSVPLVFISRGTIHGNEAMDIFNKCISVLGNMECKAIISTGSCIGENQFKDLPSNINVFEFVNQKQVLKDANVFITHGGLTGVREAISNGVPMILYPETTDQYIASRQIERFEAGIWLKNRPFCCDELVDSLQRIISTNKYMENINVLKSKLGSAGGHKIAADYISDFKKYINIM
jgi:MGT family glycosyltransferase